ncbi:hypothetical protein SGRIM128S_06568 [Streptomyces griseomycini]
MTLRAFMHGAGKTAIRKIAVLPLFLLFVSGCDSATPLFDVKAVAAGVASRAPFFDEGSGLGRDADVRSRPAHGGLQQGDAPGLYGGTGRQAICDVERLERYLTEPRNDRKARAWAKALGIRTDGIPEYLDRLTPVLLRHDTLVKNHDYKKGKAVPFHALLQAGIAVLVDERGLPAVKCSCGNPLRPFEGDKNRISVTFELAGTLYHGVEGRGPFARESPLASITAVVTEEPRPPVRAGALEPVLRGLLTKDPELRTTARAAEAELARIVMPQSEAYARTQTDLGSPSPWEVPARPAAGGETRGSATGARRRPRPHALRAVLAGGLGLVLALGGAWYALADRTHGGGDGTAAPYGETVGLAEPLKEGDCVLADWPGGTRFAGLPRLALDPSCGDEAPDGQVMAFVEAASSEEAREQGPARCEERTREVRGRLADVRGLAVVPTPEGFEAAGRRTACLVLGAHGPVYGPLGDRRRFGTAFADTATMQRRDCLDVRSRREARLVPCGGRYDEQVLGFTRLGEDVTLAEARTESDAACAREVPPRDYGFDPSVHEAGSWTGEGAWKSGTHVVVCTVRRQNGGTMEGTE